MDKEERVFLEDAGSKLWLLPHFIRRFFIRRYYSQGGVYVLAKKHWANEKPVYCSDTIKWLDKLEVETYSQKRADEMSFEFLRDKYPEYEHFIQLF